MNQGSIGEGEKAAASHLEPERIEPASKLQGG